MFPLREPSHWHGFLPGNACSFVAQNHLVEAGCFRHVVKPVRLDSHATALSGLLYFDGRRMQRLT